LWALSLAHARKFIHDKSTIEIKLSIEIYSWGLVHTFNDK